MKFVPIPKMSVFAHRLALADKIGLPLVAVGAILATVSHAMEEDPYGITFIIRPLGFLLVACGIVAVVFGTSRRRNTVIGRAALVCSTYLAKTSTWGWPDRVGLAVVAIGVPVLIIGTLLWIIFSVNPELATVGLAASLGGAVLLLLGGPRRRIVVRNSVTVVVLVIVAIPAALVSMFDSGSSGSGSSGGRASNSSSSSGGSSGNVPSGGASRASRSGRR